MTTWLKVLISSLSEKYEMFKSLKPSPLLALPHHPPPVESGGLTSNHGAAFITKLS